MSDLAADTYKALAAPFDETFVVDTFTYITGEQATTRLNEALGWDNWSFTIVAHGYDEPSDTHWVHGRLEVPGEGIIREQFGSQKVNRVGRTGQPRDYGFDLKGAATDAFKKCATGLGVGLYLSHKESRARAETPRQENVQRQAPPNNNLPRPISRPPACADCKQAITPTGRFTVESIVNTGVSKYGRALCLACGKKAQEEARLTEQEVREDMKQTEMQAAG
jgi:hypothetical protein